MEGIKLRHALLPAALVLTADCSAPQAPAPKPSKIHSITTETIMEIARLTPEEFKEKHPELVAEAKRLSESPQEMANLITELRREAATQAPWLVPLITEDNAKQLLSKID